MNAALLVFDGMTALDFVGAYDPLMRLRSMGVMPSFDWDVCAFSEPVSDGRDLRFAPDAVGQSLAEYDLVVVPGGHGTRALRRDDDFAGWLRSADADAMKASVCTGALLLGAAGFLEGRRATTHPNAFDELRPYCAEVVEEQRVVDEGDVVTARSVASSLDFGLHLVERLAGEPARERIAAQMDYPFFTREHGTAPRHA